MSVYCQPPPYIFERPPLSKTERLQFLRWFSIAISRKVCAIADLSAVGLSKYYYLIPTAEPLQFFPHSLPASFFNELLVISNLCAVLFLFYAYSTASSRIFFFFLLSCVYLRFRSPISKTRTWGLFWAFPFVCWMEKARAEAPEDWRESSNRWGRICLTKINKYEFIAALAQCGICCCVAGNNIKT